MAFDCVSYLPTGRIPDQNDSIMSRHRQVAAVRTVGHAPAELPAEENRLSLQGVQRVARPPVPDFELPLHMQTVAICRPSGL